MAKKLNINMNINMFYILVVVIIFIIIFMFIHHIKLMNKLKNCKNIVNMLQNELINNNYKENFANPSFTGAGSSFAKPILDKWIQDYKKENDVSIKYTSSDSIDGIEKIKNKNVDFGITDIHQTNKELKDSDLIQFPLVIGGIVPIVNIPDIDKPIKLTGDILSEIYLGKIKNWNNKKIKDLNKDLELPNLDIDVVYRSDPSGTSYIFTKYLSKINSEWKADTTIELEFGSEAKGSSKLVEYVKNNEGSIGYVEYSYIKSKKINYVLLENKDGKYPMPKEASFEAALDKASWDKSKEDYGIIVDKSGEDTWPITCATFVLMNSKIEKKLADFFVWCLENGDEDAIKLNYVPLPDKVKNIAKKELKI
jgi:phosphate transport system substrate-binding protein